MRASIPGGTRRMLHLCAGLLALVRLATGSAHAAPVPWEGRAALGGELNADSHGVVDLGVRRGPGSLQLFTDTIDARWAPELRHGRWWAALRIEALAAGLLISPWSNGAPDPTRSLFGSYVAPEAGYVCYLPAGFYAGVDGQIRAYFFQARRATRIPVPGPLGVFSATAQFGRWTPSAAAWMRAGVDAEVGRGDELAGIAAGRVSPRVVGEFTYSPGPREGQWFALLPRFELRAGWARAQDRVLRTRLGGLNPYVVPLAGAAWAEWLVERYVAGRAGYALHTRWFEVAALVDAAIFDGGKAVGFAFTGAWRYKRLFAEAAFGYAPWIERQEGVSRVSFWIRVGADWGRFWRL
jgi:hypothetical protein